MAPDQPGGTTFSVSLSNGLRVAAIRSVETRRVARRRRQLIVAEQDLNDAQVGAGLKKMLKHLAVST